MTFDSLNRTTSMTAPDSVERETDFNADTCTASNLVHQGAVTLCSPDDAGLPDACIPDTSNMAVAKIEAVTSRTDFKMLPRGESYDRPRLYVEEPVNNFVFDTMQIDGRDRDIVEFCEDSVAVEHMFWNCLLNDVSIQDATAASRKSVPRACFAVDADEFGTIPEAKARLVYTNSGYHLHKFVEPTRTASRKVKKIPDKRLVNEVPPMSPHRNADGVIVPGLFQMNMVFEDIETVAPKALVGRIGEWRREEPVVVAEIPDTSVSVTVIPEIQPDDKGVALFEELKAIGLALSLGGPWIGKLSEQLGIDGTTMRRWGKPKTKTSRKSETKATTTPASVIEAARKILDKHIEDCLRARGVTSFHLTDTPQIDNGN